MRAAGIISLASIAASLAAGQPMVEKRDYVVVTKTVHTTTYVDTTITIYGDAPTDGPKPYGGVKQAAKPTPHGHNQHHHHYSPPHRPAPVHKPKHHHPPPPHKPKHQYPQPPPPPSKQPKPQPSPTPVYSPPPVYHTPKPKPAPVQPPPAPKPQRPHGAPVGAAHVGDMTYYDPGLGSCGITSSSSDPIVALAVETMNNGANPNANPLCGQWITIDYQGKRTKAKITDTCYACAADDIDLSPTLFKEVAPSGDGRVSGVKWYMG